MQISDVERSGLKWGDGLCRNHLFLLQSFFFAILYCLWDFSCQKATMGGLFALRVFLPT